VIYGDGVDDYIKSVSFSVSSAYNTLSLSAWANCNTQAFSQQFVG